MAGDIGDRRTRACRGVPRGATSGIVSLVAAAFLRCGGEPPSANAPRAFEELLPQFKVAERWDLSSLAEWRIDPTPPSSLLVRGVGVDPLFLPAGALALLEDAPLSIHLIDDTQGNRLLPVALKGGIQLGGDPDLLAFGDTLLLAAHQMPRELCSRRAQCPGKQIVLLHSNGVALEAGVLPRGWQVRGVLRGGDIVASYSVERRREDGSLRQQFVRLPHSVWRSPSHFIGASEASALFFLEQRMDPDMGQPVHWSHEPRLTAGADRIWVVPTAKPDLFAFSPEGRPHLAVGWEIQDRSVPDDAYALWRAHWLASYSGTLAEQRRRAATYDRLERAKEYSAIADVKMDSRGAAYVRLNSGRPFPHALSTWVVVDHFGRAVARVELPDDARVLAFDSARVALYRESLGGGGIVSVHVVAPR